MAFVQPAGIARFRHRFRAICEKPRVRFANAKSVRMGLGEDGLTEDLNLAQSYVTKGCTKEEASKLLQALEQRRAILSLEVTKVEEVMEELTQSLGKDQSVLQQAMEAAMGIFSPSNDDYPSLESPTGYSMDKPKKK